MSAPKIPNTPGLKWRRKGEGWECIWRARDDIVDRGFRPKNVPLWSGIAPTEIEAAEISDTCRKLQDEMLVYGKGGLPGMEKFNGTLRGLINHYQIDPDSTYHKLRYHVRKNHDTLLRRLSEMHGHEDLKDVKARLVLAWHRGWTDDGKKIAAGHAFVAQLRTLSAFGATILEDAECERISSMLSKMRFPLPKPRDERMTVEQAKNTIMAAHEIGWHSIALSQAFQFELMLRQKDCIGEWVPLNEPGTSDVIFQQTKWLHGLRWSEIDDNLILRHVTSKRDKPIEVDLKLAQMVIDELNWRWPGVLEVTDKGFIVRRDLMPAAGPVVVCEATAKPYRAVEFRRKWRIVANRAGLPKSLRNQDSRAGGITEATDAGADLEHVRHAATHSNISMTQRYSRGSVEKTANVMQLRQKHRNKGSEQT